MLGVWCTRAQKLSTTYAEKPKALGVNCDNAVILNENKRLSVRLKAVRGGLLGVGGMERGRNNLQETKERQLGIRSEELGVLTLLTRMNDLWASIGEPFFELSRSSICGRNKLRPYESKTQHFNTFRFSWLS